MSLTVSGNDGNRQASRHRNQVTVGLGASTLNRPGASDHCSGMERRGGNEAESTLAVATGFAS